MNKYKKLHQYSISTNIKSNPHLQKYIQSHSKQNLSQVIGLNNFIHKKNIQTKSKIFVSSNFITKPPFNKQQLKPSNKTQQKTCYFKEDSKINFFANIFKLKIAKLSTSITHSQKERYLRRLAQTIQQKTFRGIGFQFDVDFVKQICLFASSSHINKMVLDKNPLGDEGIIKLSGFLPKMLLQQLSLVSVGLTNKGAKYLFSSLAGNCNLKILNISSIDGILKNKVTNEGAQYIRRLLNNQQCAVNTIYLDNINLGTQGTKLTFDLRNYPPLQSLILSKNQIGSKSTQFIFAKISCLPLTYLDLSKNNIMDCGIKSISHILGRLYGKNSGSVNLIYLNLSSNNISSLGLQVFCHQMSQNQTLQTLILDQNPLSGEGFFSIKTFLIKNWGLRRLSLANICPLQSDLKYVCEGLQLNRSLQWLNLSKNEIIGQVLTSILLMLIKNKCLRQIQLNSCMLSDVEIIPNYNLVNASTFACIQQIQLQNNFINTRGCDFFKRMIALNPNIWRLSLKNNCAAENVISSIKKLLSDNKNKMPSQFKLNHYKTVSDLYEQKRRDIEGKVFIMQIRQDKLKRNLLADQIGHQELNKQKLVRQIQQQRSIIKRLLRQHSLEMEYQENEEDQIFSTQACSS